MSIFNELLPKILEISNKSAKNFDDELKAAFECLEKFEEEYHSARNGGRDKIQKDKLMTTLQSIDEDDSETNAETKAVPDSTTENKRRVSKKRSKDEVDGISSPEVDKRLKRNASVKAQSIITKHIKQRAMLRELDLCGVVVVTQSPPNSVNVNLTQKLRREEPTDKSRRRRKDDGKETTVPTPVIQIKQEKVSLPPEPMDMESLPVPLNVEVKQEPSKDDVAMPPPAVPLPKSRKAAPKEKQDDTEVEEETSSRRRNTRTKNTDLGDMPAPSVPSARSTRASSRASCRATRLLEEAPPPEPRPKRTRNKKKVSDTPSVESEKENSQPQENVIAEKTRPKRTRRGRKASEKEPEKTEETEQKQEKQPEKTPEVVLKKERISQPEPKSPLLKTKNKKTETETKTSKNKNNVLEKQNRDIISEKTDILNGNEKCAALDETRVLDKVDAAVNIEMDKTMVLTNGIYNHAPDTPKNIAKCNETVILETLSRETMVLEKPNHVIMNSTVVIEKDPKAQNITDDNSLLTDDSDTEPRTPPCKPLTTQPSSAVKEKVQQFEELAARTTRTKTRAMAKMADQDNLTPPDKIIKPILSAETLNKMNSLIFNGKASQIPQITHSASKPRAVTAKPALPASTSKLSSLSRHREAADDTLKKEREDARKKKEAILEAKREMQKKKREEKMAAAAAAREAAERERQLAWQAAARERQEKQAHADHGRQEKMKELEKKKQELARKVAETEERRKAEEQARQQRLAEEQRRAELARKKQAEEAEAMKKEAAQMAKEIEKRQKEYLEKHKLKHRFEDKAHLGTPGRKPLEAVYMADGFQHLCSDEDADPPPAPVPSWSTSKMRKVALATQSCISAGLVDSLFGVRRHSPDLRDIFPDIERARLKRTSSAVWRTPPRPLPPQTIN